MKNQSNEIPQGYQLPTPLPTGKMTPRDYQNWAYRCVRMHMGNYTGPGYVNAATGAGKSLLIAMIAKKCQEDGWPCLMLARQGELVHQNADEMWACRVDNSIYCASLNRKSLSFHTVCGSEGTYARSLHDALKDQSPNVLLIDECHMVNWSDCLLDDPETQFGIIIKELLRRNPKMRIIGFTGSPFRGTDSISGDFWTGGQLCDISTDYLTQRGYLTGVTFGFGHDDTQYDLSEWQSKGEQGAVDFTSKELQAMQRKIAKCTTTTHKIMLEVQELSKDRGGVLITCSGKAHCKEAATMLPEGSWAIITEEMSVKNRKAALDKAREGKLKYILQVGCLTTGVNVPIWDVIVILRGIGSLTLLVQLIGRGLRPYFKDPELAKQYFSTLGDQNDERLAIIAASTKPDCLVLDYSSTMEQLGALYSNPILEDAQAQKAKQEHDEITCQLCGTMNSRFARRCTGKKQRYDPATDIDDRCEYFFSGRECGTEERSGCGTMNDIAARECRKCGQQLIDPNKKLTGTHYTDADLIPVTGMQILVTKSGTGVIVRYTIDDQNHPQVDEIFNPWHEKAWIKALWKKFIKQHVNTHEWRGRAYSLRTAGVIVKNAAMFDVPTHITHRVNDKGKSIINRKLFRSGREEQDESSTDDALVNE